MTNTLTDKQEALIAGERYWLDHLQLELARFSAANDDRVALSHIIRRVDELFMVLVLGESAPYQRAFINLLLGNSLMDQIGAGATRQIQLLKYGLQVERVVVEADVETLAVPSPLLQRASLVYAPAADATYEIREALLRRFAPQADIIFFVVDAAGPLSETELQLLTTLSEWEGEVVVVGLQSDPVAAETTFPPELRAEIAARLDHAPTALFLFSLQASADADAATESLLQAYITRTLKEPERIRRKLQYPLDISFRLIAKYRQIITARLELLNGDFKTIESFKHQVTAYKEDAVQQSQEPFETVNQSLQALEQRGIEFFTRLFQPAKFFWAIRKSQRDEEFRRIVIADTPATVEAQVLSHLQQLAERGRRPWELAIQKLPARQQLETDPALDRMGSSFNYNRQHLLRTTLHELQKGIDAYDVEAEVRRITLSLQQALAAMTPVAVGAAGIGTVVSHMAATIMQDVMRFPTLFKLYTVPFSRTRMRQREQWKFAAMTRQLLGILEDQLYSELEHSDEAIEAAVTPYTRFVYEELSYLNRVSDALTGIAKWLTAIENEIKTI